MLDFWSINAERKIKKRWKLSRSGQYSRLRFGEAEKVNSSAHVSPFLALSVCPASIFILIFFFSSQILVPLPSLHEIVRNFIILSFGVLFSAPIPSNASYLELRRRKTEYLSAWRVKFDKTFEQCFSGGKARDEISFLQYFYRSFTLTVINYS